MLNLKTFGTLFGLILSFFLFSNPVFSQGQKPLERGLCELPKISESSFNDNTWSIISRCERVPEEEAKAILNASFHRFLEAVEQQRHDFWKFPEKGFYRYILTIVNDSWYDISMRFVQGSFEQSPFILIERDFASLIPGCSYVRIQFISPVGPSSHDFPIEIHIEDDWGWGVKRGDKASIISPALSNVPYPERADYTRDLIYFLERIVIEPLSEDGIESATCLFLK